ncbi:MAG TPA: bifunctional ADP-dependent NAD(P)H-hydrate dehydratase/NAD(P)H-hydrate epimerase [Halomonas sp.]|uniref:bifunctional ADP-dependent NAD(P)H-hydrate dehydratase/NAD(P)H-hydrate epimerase n=1 Tax=Vreelandella aquamarina TaxID=77097 RepID=UPI0005CC6240|nr:MULTISPECIES: bifunctional ADP-dependent NAD(P)H-hydrate dehydratase/NAD(P)H-hydrate epimerase [Halomonas]KJD19656.1 carbohydrate kinase [Halomonas meridiana]MCD1651305.1 bifunctional ADP-dependent NAD(P)H-hydrate dehydratase/NAD(P)H-hydrate epimerase [Halomonas axialensis]MCD2087643.1 NAD(P)H-hydrate dehydratase [Halomonas meridiana]HBM44589.1 bifunctional ADP-dependent NAD(P)H-hydrate dehydratase/NAD(P)H-hydrate epimerase [Halomonas sp.]
MSTLSTSSLRPLYKATQVRELDQRTIAGGIESFALMQRAASSAWHSFRSRWPQARSVTVLCGGGNNGGDGHVLAALAMQSGLKVQRLSLKPRDALSGDVARAAELATAAGVGFEEWHPHTTLAGEVIVDALLGTGLSGEVEGSIKQAIKAMNTASQPVLALDIPSGISADTGAMLGTAVEATCTVTFIGDKIGLHTGDAPAYTGDIDFRPLGVKAQAFFDIPPTAWRLDDALLGEAFTPRSRTSHKGSLGHVLVMGGAPGFGGAALLASQAAARLGAGKVTLATAHEHITASLVRCPEVMVRAVRGGADAADLPASADVVVIGPGLGQESWGQAMLQSALKASSPLVVDADALNLLASRWPDLRRDNWILTPHPGEAARLLGCSVSDVQADRPEAARALQRARGGIVILKGAGSLIAGPSGLVVCPYGNPGMASGGMGDILSGILGALVGQFNSLEQSAWLGVMAHALAGDEAAKAAGERGLLASDLASYARVLINP